MMLSHEETRQLNNFEEIESEFYAKYGGNYVDLPCGARPCELQANAAWFDEGALTYARYGFPLVLGFDPAEFIRLIYPMGGQSDVHLDAEPIASPEAGYIVLGDRLWSWRAFDFGETLSVRIPAGILKQKLSYLLGEQHDEVRLRQPWEADHAQTNALRLSVFDFARELDHGDVLFRDSLINEMMERISAGLLLATCRDVQQASPHAPSRQQMARVAHYIAEHFRDPLTLQKIAEVSEVSALSVMRHFPGYHGCSLLDFLESFRVQMAHLRIAVFDLDKSVATVARETGFGSLQRLEQAYLKTFGALPVSRSNW